MQRYHQIIPQVLERTYRISISEKIKTINDKIELNKTK